MESDPAIASSTLKLGGVGVWDVISGQFSQKEQFQGEILADFCHILPKTTLQDPAAGHERSFRDK